LRSFSCRYWRRVGREPPVIPRRREAAVMDD
jgi:hypothetical protein